MNALQAVVDLQQAQAELQQAQAEVKRLEENLKQTELFKQLSAAKERQKQAKTNVALRKQPYVEAVLSWWYENGNGKKRIARGATVRESATVVLLKKEAIEYAKKHRPDALTVNEGAMKKIAASFEEDQDWFFTEHNITVTMPSDPTELIEKLSQQ